MIIQRIIIRFVVPVVLIIVGVYMMIYGINTNEKRNKFTKTTAVIEKINEEYVDADETHYGVFVTYTVDDQQYTNEIDTYIAGFRKGKKVRILYNPDDPNEILYAGKFSAYVPFIISGVAFLIGVIMLLRTVVPLFMAATSKE